MKNIITAFLALAAGIFMESYRENHIFKVQKYKLSASPKKNKEQGLRIIFLSDLHNHVYGNDNVALFEAIQNEHPDLILIGGDMLIGKHRVELSAAIRFCSKLPVIASVYYAMGNHEQRMKAYPEKYGNTIYQYMQTLKDAGIKFLDNASADIEFSDCKIRVTGLNLPIGSYARKHRGYVGRKYIEKFVGKAAKNEFQILLAHDPGHFKAYKEWGADLVLSGHLHGGVARIPGWRGVITPHLIPFPKYSGEMTTEENRIIIVSKGLGAHTIKFRILNYPEIVVVEL